MDPLAFALALLPAALGSALLDGTRREVRWRAAAVIIAAMVLASGPDPRLTTPAIERALALVVVVLTAGLVWRVPPRLRTWGMELGEYALLGLAGSSVALGDRHRALASGLVLGLAAGWALLGARAASFEGNPPRRRSTILPLVAAALVSASSVAAGEWLGDMTLGPPLGAALASGLVGVGLMLEGGTDLFATGAALVRSLVAVGALGLAMALAGYAWDGRAALPVAAMLGVVAVVGRPGPPGRPQGIPPRDSSLTDADSTPEPLGMRRETLVILERLADPLAAASEPGLMALEHVFPGAKMEMLRSPQAPPGLLETSPTVDDELLATVCRRGLIHSDTSHELSVGSRRSLRRLGRSTLLLPVAYGATVFGVLVVRDLQRQDETLGSLRRFTDLLGHRLETQRLTTELQHKQRLADLGTFAAALVHDLRSPLATARLELQLVQRSVSPPQRRALDEVVHAIDRALDDLSGTLDFTRVLDLDLARIEVRALLEAVARSCRIQADPRDVSVVLEGGGAGVEVRGDRARLLRVFENLVRNALDASCPGSTIRIQIEREDHRVVICVVDTGVGIDPELGDRIFDPFVTSKASGMGLGLAIVRKIVNAHHGQISAHGTPGEGTRMRVQLPLARDDSTPIHLDPSPNTSDERTTP